MPKANRVLSTPPTNTSATTPKSSRRGFFVQAAGVAAAGAAIGAGLPLPAPSSAAQSLDAELIELGARVEPLVDRYYVAQPALARPRWRKLTPNTIHNSGIRPIGTIEHPSEIRNAFAHSCERSGVDEASDALHAIFKEMTPLANAINAAPVSSIEGFRAKALVAFWEVAPLGAGDSEFSFDDACPFQQLFTAVAELCGLKDKMAATGYALPDIGTVEAAPDDDSDDDGEEA